MPWCIAPRGAADLVTDRRSLRPVFASFMLAVPPALRLLLAIVITVGITLFMVKALHSRLVDLSAKDGQDKDERKRREEEGETDLAPLPPESYNLANRVLGLTSTGFVFLLAFTLGNFWGTSTDARTATQAEAADWVRAVALAQQLDGGEPLEQALQEYKSSVIGPQWELMQQAHAAQASRLQVEDGQRLSQVVLDMQPQLKSQAAWPQLAAAVDDMFLQSRDRIDAVPNPAAPGVIVLIFILAITNLAMVAVFQPARMGPNLFLMGVMAAITAVMLFVLVEASNPYVGAVAVTPNGF